MIDFWSRVNVGAPEQCWLWKQSIGSHGYGQTFVGGKVRLAHRVAYELEIGKIPDGLTVDHLCHEKRCMNPAHLRLLSNEANASDNGWSGRDHCKNGHPFDGTNSYLYIRPNGWRQRRCRECRRESDRKHRESK